MTVLFVNHAHWTQQFSNNDFSSINKGRQETGTVPVSSTEYRLGGILWKKFGPYRALSKFTARNCVKTCFVGPFPEFMFNPAFSL